MSSKVKNYVLIAIAVLGIVGSQIACGGDIPQPDNANFWANGLNDGGDSWRKQNEPPHVDTSPGVFGITVDDLR